MAELTTAEKSDETAADVAPCLFWRLPPEIRNMIYGYLYGRGRTISVKVQADWALDEKE